MDLDGLRDRRVLIAAGAGGLVLVAALGVALLVRSSHRQPSTLAAASSAPQASLQVEMGSGDSGLNLKRPLRCFAGGQFVGMLTLGECAQRNGVQAGSLDVGIDTSGEVAAASDAQVLQPLPSAPAPPPSSGEASAAGQVPAAAGPAASCWRYAGDWRKLGDMTLDGCVQVLFAGKCVRPGSADYGRWGSQTLRLVTGKVERGGDTGGFHTLVKQPPGDCAIPHLTE